MLVTLVTKSTSGLLIERILLQRNVKVVQQVNWDSRSWNWWGAHHIFVQKCSSMHVIGCFPFYAYSTWNKSSQMGVVATKLWIGTLMMFQRSLKWKKLLSMRCHRMLILQGEWMTALCCKGHVTLQQHRSGGGIVLARSRLFKFFQRPLAVSWPHSGISLQHLYLGHAFGRLWDY